MQRIFSSKFLILRAVFLHHGFYRPWEGAADDPTAINEMLGLVAVLRDWGLIDGFGSQAHYFNVDQMAANPTTLRQRLDLMASGGVPVYITELDLRGSGQNESTQAYSYERVFPVFWEHPAVAGVTLWRTFVEN